MRLNDPAVLAEVTAAFQVYEQALNDNDVATLTALFWKNPLTIRRPTPSSSNATPGRRGRQSQRWMRTEAGWRVVSAHLSFLPAQD